MTAEELIKYLQCFDPKCRVVLSIVDYEHEEEWSNEHDIEFVYPNISKHDDMFQVFLSNGKFKHYIRDRLEKDMKKMLEGKYPIIGVSYDIKSN